jgi:hypothetical protein
MAAKISALQTRAIVMKTIRANYVIPRLAQLAEGPHTRAVDHATWIA